MAIKTAAQAAQKWATNLGAAGPSITAGVNAPRANPAQAAIAAQATMVQRWQDSVNSGKWAQNLGAVTLQQWQQAMLKKGIPNLANGIMTGQPKVQAFLQNFLPYVYQVQATVRAMPNATLQQRLQRMTQNATLLAQYRKSAGASPAILGP